MLWANHLNSSFQFWTLLQAHAALPHQGSGAGQAMEVCSEYIDLECYLNYHCRMRTFLPSSSDTLSLGSIQSLRFFPYTTEYVGHSRKRFKNVPAWMDFILHSTVPRLILMRCRSRSCYPSFGFLARFLRKTGNGLGLHLLKDLFVMLWTCLRNHFEHDNSWVGNKRFFMLRLLLISYLRSQLWHWRILPIIYYLFMITSWGTYSHN